MEGLIFQKLLYQYSSTSVFWKPLSYQQAAKNHLLGVLHCCRTLFGAHFGLMLPRNMMTLTLWGAWFWLRCFMVARNGSRKNRFRVNWVKTWERNLSDYVLTHGQFTLNMPRALDVGGTTPCFSSRTGPAFCEAAEVFLRLYLSSLGPQGYGDEPAKTGRVAKFLKVWD